MVKCNICKMSQVTSLGRQSEPNCNAKGMIKPWRVNKFIMSSNREKKYSTTMIIFTDKINCLNTWKKVVIQSTFYQITFYLSYADTLRDLGNPIALRRGGSADWDGNNDTLPPPRACVLLARMDSVWPVRLRAWGGALIWTGKLLVCWCCNRDTKGCWG